MSKCLLKIKNPIIGDVSKVADKLWKKAIGFRKTAAREYGKHLNSNQAEERDTIKH